MTPQSNRRPGTNRAPTNQHETTTIPRVTDPGPDAAQAYLRGLADGARLAAERSRRARRWASRELDALLADECGCCCHETSRRRDVLAGDPWHDTHMDRGVPEREYRGEELATAGWSA